MKDFMIYYLNGEFISDNVNAINISDRGFLLGDGIFTTLKSINGTLKHFDKHVNRLCEHSSLIKIHMQLNYQELFDICSVLLIKNNLDKNTALIRITVTRGISERGINIPSRELQQPTILIRAMSYSDHLGESLKICSTSIIRNEHSILSKIKSLNYLEQILARDEAITKGYDDGLMVNGKDNITECSVSNIFLLSTFDEIITPPISGGLLPGIVRGLVISICQELGFNVIERSIKLSDINILSYKAGFLTNCAMGIKSIGKINDIIFSTVEPIIITIKQSYDIRL